MHLNEPAGPQRPAENDSPSPDRRDRFRYGVPLKSIEIVKKCIEKKNGPGITGRADETYPSSSDACWCCWWWCTRQKEKPALPAKTKRKHTDSQHIFMKNTDNCTRAKKIIIGIPFEFGAVQQLETHAKVGHPTWKKLCQNEQISYTMKHAPRLLAT